jgi:hypothetical protein
MRKKWSRTARRSGRRMTSTPRTRVTRRCSAAAGPAPGAREAPAPPHPAPPRPPPPNPDPRLLNRNWNASVKGILIVANLSILPHLYFCFYFFEAGSTRTRVSFILLF